MVNIKLLLVLRDALVMVKEVFVLGLVYSAGMLLAIGLGDPPHYGGTLTVLAYATLWIAFSKYRYDTFWAIKQDFKSDIRKVDLTGWENDN